MSKPEELPIMLNLEESGTLCHLLMQALLEMKKTEYRSAILDNRALATILARQEHLYSKLANVNDKLMAKIL